MKEVLSHWNGDCNHQNGTVALSQGENAFAARIALIKRAEITLDLQYYIWQADLTGKALLAETLNAANKGVKVRLLLDDLNLIKFQDELALINQNSNIQVRVMNPFYFRRFKILDIFRFNKMNHRMHNKAIIADNRGAIVGGRNIGDEYFDASGVYNFGDMDLFVFGPVIQDVTKEFELYWENELSTPIEKITNLPTKDDAEDFQNKLLEFKEMALESSYAKFLKDNSQKGLDSLEIYWQETNVYYDQPEKLLGKNKSEYLFQVLKPFLKEAKKEVTLISPYFVPGKFGMEMFKELTQRGVKVSVITNSLSSSDVLSVFSGYQKYRKRLLKLGVHLYEIKGKQNHHHSRSWLSGSSATGLHTKSFIFDNEKVFVGSMNLDERSRSVNTEMGIVTHGRPFADFLNREIFDNLSRLEYELKLHEGRIMWTDHETNKNIMTDPGSRLWERVLVKIFSWIVPESLL